MTHKLSITDLPIKGKKVLMRVDFNVPLDSDGEISDDTRVAASLHSINYVLEAGGTVILMSHLGRPRGVVNKKFSLAPCAALLSKMLGRKVIMAEDCVGHNVEEIAGRLKPGAVLLLENLRFHPEEEMGDLQFAEKLAKLGDCYVNDAYGTAHRNHASTVAITRYFPDASAAGFLMQKEIDCIGGALLNPERPFWAIIGGAKISTKIRLLKSLVHLVDGLIIGGGMAYTFFKAKGIDIGDSLLEEDMIPVAQEILEEYQKYGVELLLPIDHLVADSINQAAKSRFIMVDQTISKHEMGVDIGPRTIALFTEKIRQAKTLFWNGPLGVFEVDLFAAGTKKMAEEVAHLKAITIVGGGDSAAAVHAAGYADQMTHISTGGGANLEYIQNGSLPAIEALTDASGC